MEKRPWELNISIGKSSMEEEEVKKRRGGKNKMKFVRVRCCVYMWKTAEGDDQNRCAWVGGKNWWDAKGGNVWDGRHIFNPHEKYSTQTQKRTNCLLLRKPAKASLPPSIWIEYEEIHFIPALLITVKIQPIIGILCLPFVTRWCPKYNAEMVIC